jgi:cysteine synthase A
VIVMPNNQSEEKISLLRALGATVELVPAAPFADPNNYYHVAKRRAEALGAFWANQFENTANADAHYETTGPEIWADTGGDIDGFVCSSGTGGTIGGTSAFLKEKRSDIATYVIDCEGSSLFNYVTSGSLEASGSSVLEGIGIRRITANFARARLDGAFAGTDREAIAMVHELLAHDGLFVGGSAGLNCVGAVKLAEKLGPGKTIVTMLCDSGQRYQARLFNNAWLKEKNLPTLSA